MTSFHRWNVLFAATRAAAARTIVSSVMAVSACATAEDLPDDALLSELDAATSARAEGAESAHTRGGATWVPPSGTGAGGGLAASGSPTVSGNVGATAGGQSSDSGAECPQGQKRCGGLCVPPNPGVGCGFEGCEPCPLAPEGAHRSCDGASCSYECNAGFERSPDAMACIAHAAGGAGGALSDDGGSSRGGAPTLLDAGGTGASPAGGGGSSSGCVPSLCTVPSPYAMPCCTSFGSCGCVYVGGIFCSPC